MPDKNYIKFLRLTDDLSVRFLYLQFLPKNVIC